MSAGAGEQQSTETAWQSSALSRLFATEVGRQLPLPATALDSAVWNLRQLVKARQFYKFHSTANESSRAGPEST